MPLQGATAPTRDTQGVASLALGYVLHWAFSPSLLNPKLEVLIRAVLIENASSNGGDASRVGGIFSAASSHVGHRALRQRLTD